MRKGEKEEKVTNLQPYADNQISEWAILDKRIKNVVIKEWKNLDGERQEEDLLFFMETFDFPDLQELRQSLTDSGEYKPEQIEEIISGLKTLPEYRD